MIAFNLTVRKNWFPISHSLAPSRHIFWFCVNPPPLLKNDKELSVLGRTIVTVGSEFLLNNSSRIPSIKLIE